ncbi:MAG TPA: outer membrane beta-barrel protein, partial [Gammaproteobacteria bacterium]|nr:outer membrane beta-barrel protein [Gammaproteobacteria bacterium]
MTLSTFKKAPLVVALLIASSASFAYYPPQAGYSGYYSMYSFMPAFYIGGQGGYSRAIYDNRLNNEVQLYTSSSSTEGGLGGRVYAGVYFNPFFSAEVGYTQYADNDYKATSGASSMDFNFENYAWDISGKLTYPFGMSAPWLAPYSTYFKFGAAYMTTKFTKTGTLQPSFGTALASGKDTAWAPLIGIGAAVSFNPFIMMDVSWT